MKFQSVLKYFEPLRLNDELINANYKLLLKEGVYHSLKEKRNYFWLYENNVDGCDEVGESFEGRLSPESSLCFKCLSISVLIRSADDSVVSRDLFEAFHELNEVPLSPNYDLIFGKDNDLLYYVQLQGEFIRAVDDFHNNSQGYFYLSSYDPSLADMLIKKQMDEIDKVHKLTINNKVVLDLIEKFVVEKLNLPLIKDEISLALSPFELNDLYNLSYEDLILDKDLNLIKDEDRELLNFEGDLECSSEFCQDRKFYALKSIIWLMVIIFNDGVYWKERLSKVPLWFYNLLSIYAPDVIKSSIYKEFNEEALSIAEKLWSERGERGTYSSFDNCYQAALMLIK